MEEVVRSGYLTKSPPPGNAMKGWKKRFFVLFPSKMEYFGSANERMSGRAHKGYIPLKGAQVSLGKEDPKKNAYHFKISSSDSSKRIFELVAASKNECDEWVKDINAVLSGKSPQKGIKKQERRGTLPGHLGAAPVRKSRNSKATRPLPGTPEDSSSSSPSPSRASTSQQPQPRASASKPSTSQSSASSSSSSQSRQSSSPSKGGGSSGGVKSPSSNKSRGGDTSHLSKFKNDKDYPWKFPSIERSKAEEYLRRQPGNVQGLFLVRKSNKQSGAYAISLLNSGKCVHHIIKPSSRGYVINDKVATQYFELGQLVEFLKKPHRPPLNWKVPLTAYVDNRTHKIVGAPGSKKPVGFAAHAGASSGKSSAGSKPPPVPEPEPEPEQPRTERVLSVAPTTEYDSDTDDEGEWFIAVEDFEPTSPDKIGLIEGEKYNVQIQDEGGWWYVIKGENEGWAPSSFLDPCDPPFEDVIDEGEAMRARTATEAGAKFAMVATSTKLYNKTKAEGGVSEETLAPQDVIKEEEEQQQQLQKEEETPPPMPPRPPAQHQPDDDGPPPPMPPRPGKSTSNNDDNDDEGPPPPRPARPDASGSAGSSNNNDAEDHDAPPPPPRPPGKPGQEQEEQDDLPPPRPPSKPSTAPSDDGSDSPPPPPRPPKGDDVPDVVRRATISENTTSAENYEEAVPEKPKPFSAEKEPITVNLDDEPYDDLGVVEPVVLPSGDPLDPTSSYEMMSAPMKPNNDAVQPQQSEEDEDSGDDVANYEPIDNSDTPQSGLKDTVEPTKLNSATAEKVREMRNEDRITLMYMFKEGKLTEEALLKHVNDYEAGLVDNAIPDVNSLEEGLDL